MESGREQNYWPGFVDALSNVVLTLVFVLVIFVFALAMASSKVDQKLQEIEKKAAVSKNGQQNNNEENAKLKEQLAAMTLEIKKLKNEALVRDNVVVETNNQQSKLHQTLQNKLTAENEQKSVTTGPVQVTLNANKILLDYPLGIAEMDQNSSNQLVRLLDAFEKNNKKHKIVMLSFIGSETYSVAQRLAYFRAVGARSLLTKSGEDPSNIKISIVSPPNPDIGHVEITFQDD